MQIANARGKNRKADVLEETPESDSATTTKAKAKAKNKLTRKQQIQQLSFEEIETDHEADDVDGDKENSEASG